MHNFFFQLKYILEMIKINTPMVLLILGILWGIHMINWGLRYKLNYLGIVPRNIFGLIGIPCSPFLHGGFSHLLFNSIPLFLLMNFVLMDGVHVFITVSISIIVMTGIAVWLFGRPAIHIGASGLIMGYWAFLITSAYHERSVMTILLAIISIYYFWGLILSVFPTKGEASWEGHLFGLLSGIAAYYLYPFVSHKF